MRDLNGALLLHYYLKASLLVLMFIYWDENPQRRKKKLNMASDKLHSENILCIFKKNKQKIPICCLWRFSFFLQSSKLKLYTNFTVLSWRLKSWMLQEQGISSRKNIFFPWKVRRDLIMFYSHSFGWDDKKFRSF